MNDKHKLQPPTCSGLSWFSHKEKGMELLLVFLVALSPGQPNQGTADSTGRLSWEKNQGTGRESTRNKEAKAPHALLLLQSEDWPGCWQERGWEDSELMQHFQMFRGKLSSQGCCWISPYLTETETWSIDFQILNGRKMAFFILIGTKHNGL